MDYRAIANEEIEEMATRYQARVIPRSGTGGSPIKAVEEMIVALVDHAAMLQAAVERIRVHLLRGDDLLKAFGVTEEQAQATYDRIERARAMMELVDPKKET